MSTALVIVTVLTAAWVGFSAFSLLRRAPFVVDPLNEIAPDAVHPVMGKRICEIRDGKSE